MKKAELIKRLFTNEEIISIDNRNRELEEENKALRENVNHRAGRCADLSEDKEELEKENKKLKEENEILKEYKSMYEGLIVN